MAFARWATLPKLRWTSAMRVRMPNQISTWLSQLPCLGVKTKLTRGWLANHPLAAGPVRVLMLSVIRISRPLR